MYVQTTAKSDATNTFYFFRNETQCRFLTNVLKDVCRINLPAISLSRHVRITSSVLLETYLRHFDVLYGLERLAAAVSVEEEEGEGEGEVDADEDHLLLGRLEVRVDQVEAGDSPNDPAQGAEDQRPHLQLNTEQVSIM